MKAISLVCLVLGVVGVSWGQPPCVIFYEIDQILTERCDGGNCLPDGTPVCIYWDRNRNGPEWCDELVPVGENEFNFDCFPLNGEELFGQCGQFFGEQCWTYSGGGLPTPNRFYLRTCGQNVTWVTNVFTIAAGPQEINLDWTCSPQPCGAAPPLPIVFESYSPLLTCPCGSGQELPSPLPVRIMLDVNGNGHDDADSTLEILTWTCFRDTCQAEWFAWCLDSIPVYLQIESGGCCLQSNVIRLSDSRRNYIIENWDCANSTCGVSSGAELIITFDGNLQGLGCPCENPIPFPDGTPVCLWRDWTNNGPSEDDAEVACFPYSAGSGQGSWDGRWVPLPGDPVADGFYYVQISTDACCWQIPSFSHEGGEPEYVQRLQWECLPITECVSRFAIPAPPTNVVATRIPGDSVLVTWAHSGEHVNSFTVGLDTIRHYTVSRFERSIMFPSWSSFQTSYCVTANGTAGNSRPACDTVAQVPPPIPPWDVNFDCDTGTLSWQHNGARVEHFTITRDGINIAWVSPQVRLYSDIASPPGPHTYCVIAVGFNESSPPACTVVNCSGAVVQAELPHRDRLGPNGVSISPNPFNPTTRIAFVVPIAQRVSLVIYDLRGREVERLIDENLTSGVHTREWNASPYPSGVYFAKLALGNDVRVEKLLLLK